MKRGRKVDYYVYTCYNSFGGIMEQMIFTLVVNPETKQIKYIGNVAPRVVLQILQDLVISEAVNTAKQEIDKTKEGKGEAN